jgi:hypothetical protein
MPATALESRFAARLLRLADSKALCGSVSITLLQTQCMLQGLLRQNGQTNPD